jgi:hypothetical protein
MAKCLTWFNGTPDLPEENMAIFSFLQKKAADWEAEL